MKKKFIIYINIFGYRLQACPIAAENKKRALEKPSESSPVKSKKMKMESESTNKLKKTKQIANQEIINDTPKSKKSKTCPVKEAEEENNTQSKKLENAQAVKGNKKKSTQSKIEKKIKTSKQKLMNGDVKKDEIMKSKKKHKVVKLDDDHFKDTKKVENATEKGNNESESETTSKESKSDEDESTDIDEDKKNFQEAERALRSLSGEFDSPPYFNFEEENKEFDSLFDHHDTTDHKSSQPHNRRESVLSDTFEPALPQNEAVIKSEGSPDTNENVERDQIVPDEGTSGAKCSNNEQGSEELDTEEDEHNSVKDNMSVGDCNENDCIEIQQIPEPKKAEEKESSSTNEDPFASLLKLEEECATLQSMVEQGQDESTDSAEITEDEMDTENTEIRSEEKLYLTSKMSSDEKENKSILEVDSKNTDRLDSEQNESVLHVKSEVVKNKEAVKETKQAEAVEIKPEVSKKYLAVPAQGYADIEENAQLMEKTEDNSKQEASVNIVTEELVKKAEETHVIVNHLEDKVKPMQRSEGLNIIPQPVVKETVKLSPAPKVDLKPVTNEKTSICNIEK